MIRRSSKLLLSLLLIPALAIAAPDSPTGYLNLNGSTPSLIARDGHDLIVGTEGDDDFKVVLGQTTPLIIDGATGAVVFSGAVTASSFTGTLAATLANNTFLKARNAADDANIDVLKVDASYDTQLNADSGDNILLTIGGSTEAFLNTSALSPGAVAGNALGTAALPWAQLFQGGVAIDATDVVGIRGNSAIFSAINNSTTGDNVDHIAYGANTVGANIGLFKTRATTTDANTIVSASDQIGNIVFYGADGATYRAAASIIATVDGTPGSSDMPGAISFNTTLDGASSPTVAMKIAETGHLVFTRSDIRIRGTDASARAILITPDSNAASAAYLNLYTDATNGGHGSISSGIAAGADVQLSATDDVIIETRGGTDMWNFDTATGTMIGAGTGSIGWTLVSAANQACTTTCVTPCVMGQETTSKAFLACSDATADICLCAGAS